MKLYVDMDGVLTDFEKAVSELGEEASLGLSENATEKQKQVMYRAIENAGESFWANMSWKEGARDLWDLLKRFNPVLLSSTSTFSCAESGKLLWIKNNIPGTTLFLSDNKYEYIDPYEVSVLIDDNKDNIRAWEAKGGIGILHTSAGDTERKFMEFLWTTPEINISDYFS